MPQCGAGGSRNLELMLTKEKYNFLFKRTCFRLMSEFFKSLFLSYVKKEAPGNKKVHKNFKSHIQHFTNKFFSHIFGKLPNHQWRKEFCGFLTIIVHSHRHNSSILSELSNSFSKDDSEEASFTSELDFSLCRDPMYKYSIKAKQRFFQVPELSFLFFWFATQQTALQQAKTKVEAKGADYSQRIMKDIEELKSEALASL